MGKGKELSSTNIIMPINGGTNISWVFTVPLGFD